MQGARSFTQIGLRVPEWLRQRIMVAATRSRRSINAELNLVLERVYGPENVAVTGDKLAGHAPVAVFQTTALAGGHSRQPG